MTEMRLAPAMKAVCASRESATRVGKPNSRMAERVGPMMGHKPPIVWVKAMKRAGRWQRWRLGSMLLLVFGSSGLTLAAKYVVLWASVHDRGLGDGVFEGGGVGGSIYGKDGVVLEDSMTILSDRTACQHEQPTMVLVLPLPIA